MTGTIFLTVSDATCCVYMCIYMYMYILRDFHFTFLLILRMSGRLAPMLAII